MDEKGIDTDSVSVEVPQRRHLSKSYGLYTVCEFVIDNPAEAYLIYTFGKEKANEIIFGKEGLEKLKEDLDEEWEDED